MRSSEIAPIYAQELVGAKFTCHDFQSAISNQQSAIAYTI